MIILNAPGFFGMTWSLIKNFIDPQTAKRIQLFSNKEQGLKALQELIDVDEIPKDYGGNNKSVADAFLQEANDPSLLRQEIELIHVKRKGKGRSKQEWSIKQGEYMELACYTRSVSGARITVQINGVTSSFVNCQVDCSTEPPKAAHRVITSRIKGPSTISLLLEDLDNVDKKHSKLSRGYFLIVGDVRRPLASMKTVDMTKKPMKKRKLRGSMDVANIPKTPIDYWNLDESERFKSLRGASVEEMMKLLTNPHVCLDTPGYPGCLTKHQLNECEKFLTDMPESIQDHIYSFRDVEDPAYTICRWVRATKWDAGAILQRCQENQPRFEQAKNDQFYPDVSQALGAPFPVFLTQYPMLPIGRARNGCPVNYFLAGKIHPEGVLALTTVENVEGYFWWGYMHQMKQDIRQTLDKNPDYVRCEGINIIDLKGLSRAALSSETMEVIKLSSKISDYFPEVSWS